MNKQELIEKLKQHGAWCTDCHDINGEKDRYVKFAKVRELLEQIDEPQVEKVEVPESLDEYLNWCESYKWITENIVKIENVEYFENHSESTGLTQWVKDNYSIFLIAVSTGKYTIRPKRWVVKFKDAEMDFYFMGWSDIYKTDDNPFVPNGYVEKDKDRVFIFVDKSKAEAVATLVEGSVEEV